MTEICAECGQPVHPGATRVLRGERGPEMVGLPQFARIIKPATRAFGKPLSDAMEDEQE